jgi:hypothetical protein
MWAAVTRAAGQKSKAATANGDAGAPGKDEIGWSKTASWHARPLADDEDAIMMSGRGQLRLNLGPGTRHTDGKILLGARHLCHTS